jgi:ribosomal protein L31
MIGVFLSVSALLAVVACVGDDATPSSAVPDSGGGAGSDSPSGGGPTDALMPDARDLDASMADTSPADGPVAFNPGKIPGLVLWLDAQDDARFTTSGGKVTGWADKSTATNDAHSVAIGGSEPTRMLSATLGKQVVHFTGPAQVLAVNDNATLYFHDTDDFVIAFVASYTHVGQGGFVAKSGFPNNGDGFIFFTATTGNPCFTINNVCGEFPVTTGVFHRFVARRTAGGLELHTSVDGVEVKVRNLAAAVDVSEPTHPLYIGADRINAGVVSEGMTGDIAEVLIYHSPGLDAGASAADLSAVDQYLKAKWGL